MRNKGGSERSCQVDVRSECTAPVAEAGWFGRGRQRRQMRSRMWTRCLGEKLCGHGASTVPCPHVKHTLDTKSVPSTVGLNVSERQKL